MSFTNNQLIGIGVIGFLTLWYLKNKATETVKDVGEAVNPVNQDNIFNRGFNGLYGAVTDGEGTLGTDIADFFHGVDG